MPRIAAERTYLAKFETGFGMLSRPSFDQQLQRQQGTEATVAFARHRGVPGVLLAE